MVKYQIELNIDEFAEMKILINENLKDLRTSHLNNYDLQMKKIILKDIRINEGIINKLDNSKMIL